ncbi:MAG: hypothetical protein JWM58_1874 [Rhizobium sp.]|nr:hypothetical protein [Rhizobium sp.]
MGKLAAMIIGLSAATIIGSGNINLSSLGLAELPGKSVPKADCRIKGNVSYNADRRIYHMPGQERFNDTKISPQRGERWFCSEAEARAAGWEKAGR